MGRGAGGHTGGGGCDMANAASALDNSESRQADAPAKVRSEEVQHCMCQPASGGRSAAAAAEAVSEGQRA